MFHVKILTLWIFVFPVTVKGAQKTVKVTANLDRAIITSPNYPQPYARSHSIEWNILANSSITDAIIHLQVIDSELSNIYTCYEDIVEVMDGPNSMYSVIKDWCGDSFPSGVIKTSGDTATVSFSTNKKDNNYKGFKLEYWAATKDLTEIGPVQMTPAHWVLVGLSVIVHSLLIGGCLFLIAVRNNVHTTCRNLRITRAIFRKRPDKDRQQHQEENDEKIKKKLKLKEITDQYNTKHEPESKVPKLPPLNKTIRPTMNIQQWKNMLTSK